MPVRRSSSPARESRSTKPFVGKAEVRGRLLKAAANQFMQHGFSETTMDAVAEEAGASKRTIYKHFKDKIVLYEEVMHHLARPVQHPIRDLAKDRRSPEEVLAEAAEWIYRLCMDEMQRSVARNCVAEAKRFPELAREMLRTGMDADQGTLAPLIRYFRVLIDRGEIELDDPFAAADMFCILALGGVRFLLVDDWPAPERQAWVRNIVQVFLHGASVRATAARPGSKSAAAARTVSKAVRRRAPPQN